MTKSESLLFQFESVTLPKSEWTHEAHLRVALAILGESALDAALCKLRAGIISLNNAHQTPNTISSGYHETLTVFWATVIHLFLTEGRYKQEESQEGAFLQSGLAAKTLPFQFYEKEKVLGPDHRARYILPTKMPLNWENLSKFLNP